MKAGKGILFLFGYEIVISEFLYLFINKVTFPQIEEFLHAQHVVSLDDELSRIFDV